MTFGEKLLRLRKQANLSQQGLAQKLGLTRQVISKWEKGKGLPDIDNLKNISKFFNITIDELIDYKLEEVDFKFDETSEKLEENGYKYIKNYILKKFESADEIFELSQEINLSIWQEIVYSLLDFDVVLGIHDLIENGIVYSFFVRQNNDKFLVLAKKSILLTKRLNKDFKKRHLIIDGYRYTKIKKLI